MGVKEIDLIGSDAPGLFYREATVGDEEGDEGTKGKSASDGWSCASGEAFTSPLVGSAPGSFGLFAVFMRAMTISASASKIRYARDSDMPGFLDSIKNQMNF